MRSRKRLFLDVAALMGATGILSAVGPAFAQMTQATCQIPFTGDASGGALVLSDTLNRNCRFLALDTAQGESAESVAERLAQAIKEQNPFWLGGMPVFASGGSLGGLVGSCPNYMTAGTEAGLGIPPPPSSLSCNYDSVSKKLRLEWRNPSSQAYESIRLVSNYHNYDWRGEDAVPGTQESYLFDMSTPFRSKYGAIDDFDVWVTGVSHNVPSNAAAIHVRGQVQEELFGIPFAGGLAPNWTLWSADKSSPVACEMGERDGLANKPGIRRFNAVATPETKPFYQILTESAQGDAPGGVRRDYLGLTAGHTYRISVRLNTLELGSASGQWTYSLHATPYGAANTSITPEQMAGRAPLPDGTKGESAGLVAKYDGGKTTDGRYEECAREIVLTEGTDSIRVWLKFSADRAGNKVAMDYAKLEDLGVK